MAKSTKADLGGIGSFEKQSTRMSNRFSITNYTQYEDTVQCSYCGSDYLGFSVDTYCQRCQQRVEYIVREHQATVEKARRSRR